MALSQLFWDVLMPWNLKSTYLSLKMIHFLSLNIWYVIYVVFWIKYWNLKLPHHCILFLFTICTVSQIFGTLFPSSSPGCARVCMCAARSKTNKKSTLWAAARPNDQIHTKYVKTASLESIHLNTVHVLKWTRTFGRKSDVCQCFVLKWQTASSMLIKEKITHSS